MVDLSRDTNTTARRAYRECHRFVVLFISTIASNIFSTGLAGIDGHAVFYHRGGSSLLKKKKKIQLTCRETILSLLFSNASQTQEKTQLEFTEQTFLPH